MAGGSDGVVVVVTVGGAGEWGENAPLSAVVVGYGWTGDDARCGE